VAWARPACYPRCVPCRIRRRAALSLAAVLAFAGCALRADDPPELPARAVDATAGERFTIALESNASTGFRWYLDAPRPDPNVVRVVSSEYRAPAQPLAGAPGSEVWTFDAFAPGTTTLAFAYRRPWAARDTPPARRERYAVRVRAKP